MSQTDPRDYRQFLDDQDEEGRRRFFEEYGGGMQPISQVVAFATQSPAHEAIVCEKILKVFGVQILTSAQRLERANLTAAGAAIRSADHASKANEISAAANKLALEANQKADKANEISRQTMRWAMVSGVVAVIALLVSLCNYFWPSK